MKSNYIKRLVWVSGLFTAVLIAGWYMAGAENRMIHRVIRDVQEGFRMQDVAVCMGHLSKDYLDDYGYRPVDISSILREAFRSLEDINVIILDKQVTREHHEAVVDLEFRVVATHELGVRGYIIGSMKQPARVQIRMKKPDRSWQVVSISRIDNTGTQH